MATSGAASDCGVRCFNERKTYCKDLQKWGRNLLYMIGTFVFYRLSVVSYARSVGDREFLCAITTATARKRRVLSTALFTLLRFIIVRCCNGHDRLGRLFLPRSAISALFAMTPPSTPRLAAEAMRHADERR